MICTGVILNFQRFCAISFEENFETISRRKKTKPNFSMGSLRSRCPVVLSPFRNASRGEKPHPRSSEGISKMPLPAPVALHDCRDQAPQRESLQVFVPLRGAGGGRMYLSAIAPYRWVHLLQVLQPAEHATHKTPASPALCARGVPLSWSCPNQRGWGATPACFLAPGCSSPASLCQGCPLPPRRADLWLSSASDILLLNKKKINTILIQQSPWLKLPLVYFLPLNKYIYIQY